VSWTWTGNCDAGDAVDRASELPMRGGLVADERTPGRARSGRTGSASFRWTCSASSTEMPGGCPARPGAYEGPAPAGARGRTGLPLTCCALLRARCPARIPACSARGRGVCSGPRTRIRLRPGPDTRRRRKGGKGEGDRSGKVRKVRKVRRPSGHQVIGSRCAPWIVMSSRSGTSWGGTARRRDGKRRSSEV
jgi:hypothetical protein